MFENHYINKYFNGHRLIRQIDYDPYNPLNLPPYTIRLRFMDDATPTFSKGVGVQLSSSPNVWDLTYENTDWSYILNHQYQLLEVIGANTTGVTDMSYMFYGSPSLTIIPLFDTSNVTNMSAMFSACGCLNYPLFDTSSVTDMSSMFEFIWALNKVPLFNTSNVTNMSRMFHNCGGMTEIPLFNTNKVRTMELMFGGCSNLKTLPLFDTTSVWNMIEAFDQCFKVESGALALYQQMITQENPPSYHNNCFRACGRDTETGLAELQQIPSEWGGLA